jgi:ATP-dependent DNA helicase DinG
MDYRKQIDDILGPEGVLARSMPGYEHRTQQVQMAIQVFEALASGGRLIIEAPTGTGKTLAYLVAAILSRQRVAISTGTKNLQEQLFLKDIPFLRERIFPGVKAALLKGRGNFVCHHRLRRFLRQPYLEGLSEAHSLKGVLAWYRETRNTGQGDRVELDHLPDDDPIWPEISATSETCLGRKCDDRDDCFVLKMKARAAEADLMVVNHHLVASDLVVKESGFGEVIPRYEALIVDEAHGLEEALTQHFGFHLSYSKVARLVRDVRSELGPAAAKQDKFREALAEIEDHTRRLFAAFQEGAGIARRLGPISAGVAEIRDALAGRLDVLASMLPNLPGASDELGALARRSHDIRTEVTTILGEDSKEHYACWVERRERSLMLHASPVEVGEMMKHRLYDKVSSLVFTSATLSSGGDFQYFKSRLGLNHDANACAQQGQAHESESRCTVAQADVAETILDSPFDYVRQTLLYIPESIPEPNAPDFIKAMAPILEDILTRTRGRAFVLFTSHRNMVAAHKEMEGRVPFPLLLQGTKPKTRLIEEFRERKGSVLFGTSSFWEGVDVQGEALSCVIVDRLPFAPPDDPVVASRVERIRKEGGNPFYSFQVPMAVIALKQGLGRLIRTRADRGVLCVLDKRILTKPYGRVFRKSLHESPLRRNTQAIEAFFSLQETC